jgi:hypothetical protein
MAGEHRGELKDLAIRYLIDIEQQGYARRRCDVGVFKPEV